MKPILSASLACLAVQLAQTRFPAILVRKTTISGSGKASALILAWTAPILSGTRVLSSVDLVLKGARLA